MNRFMTWLVNKFENDDEEVDLPIRPAGMRATPAPRQREKNTPTPAEFSTELEGKIIDGGPGKNVLVRNKYLREDTGTHETLKIIDESILNSDDEDGIDPYNTGRFDRSKSWDSSRSRK
jgi:hypothetical protein